MPQQYVIEQKSRMVEEVAELLKKYDVVGIASLHKVGSSQIQELRKRLHGTALIKVIKNTIFKRALEKCGKPGIEKLAEYLKGSNIFLFSDVNPFKLQLILDQCKVKRKPKAGDIATDDIIVPAGNTGIPPGPVISELNAVGIPTRIEAGSVWVVRDTLVAKKGEVISRELALALARLNVKAITVGLSLKAAYVDGLVIPGELLSLDLDKLREDIAQAHRDALALSVEIAYPTPENIVQLIQLAHRRALGLSLEASIPTDESLPMLLARAEAQASALYSLLSSRGYPPSG